MMAKSICSLTTVSPVLMKFICWALQDTEKKKNTHSASPYKSLVGSKMPLGLLLGYLLSLFLPPGPVPLTLWLPFSAVDPPL